MQQPWSRADLGRASLQVAAEDPQIDGSVGVAKAHRHASRFTAAIDVGWSC